MQDSYNIYAVFDATAEEEGTIRPVIYLGTKYSYLKVKALAERFAAALLGLGVTPGRRLSSICPTPFSGW